MKRFKEILFYSEVIGFLVSWLLILAGVLLYLSVRLGYQANHSYALGGAILIVPPAMLATTIHFTRLHFAGKKWHIPFLLLAAFLLYVSLEFLHHPRIGLNPYHPMAGVASFAVLLLGLSAIRTVWVYWMTPEDTKK